MRMFNQDCDMTYEEFEASLDYSFNSLCHRIHQNSLEPEDRERIKALPNYDPELFTEITGIQV